MRWVLRRIVRVQFDLEYSYRYCALCLLIKKAAGLMAVALLLIGCVTQPVNTGENVARVQAGEPNQATAQLSRAAIVSSGSPRLDPTQPSSISWDGRIKVGGIADEQQAVELAEQIRGILQRQIRAKGYSLLSMAGDFQLEVALVRESPSQTGATLQTTGIDAGLSADAATGTLVLALRQGRVQRWRGAVQIVAMPELTDNERYQRIQTAVGQLLTLWP